MSSISKLFCDRVGHATVSRWLKHGSFPEQPSPQRKTRLDPHLKVVAERWEAGCHNIAQLHRELVAAGHTLTYRDVYRQLVRYLLESRKKGASGSQIPLAPVLAREAVFLFLRRSEDLLAENQETLTLLRSLHEVVAQAYELVQQFTQMLRTRTGEQLGAWLEKVRTSQIHEIQGFVVGFEGDKKAVKVGLTLQESQGMVEGNVNKLKLMKSPGYGRAYFALLRPRVLHSLEDIFPWTCFQTQAAPLLLCSFLHANTQASPSRSGLSHQCRAFPGG